MTILSLKCLAHFLNQYPPTGRVADYGGTDEIGGNIVRTMLKLEEVNITEGDRKKKINLFVNGSGLKKSVPEYLALDYDTGWDLMEPIGCPKFDSGICMDLLEHVKNPFTVAKNISNSLKKGAMLFITVPFVMEVHGYPDDYWRFTPHGLEELFPKMSKITIETIRDKEPEEELPRYRLVAVFKKI
jgi:hypothetical protein